MGTTRHPVPLGLARLPRYYCSFPSGL